LANHLRAQALSAQKAEDRKIFWVEFAPQFHAHLVKCTVALVPHPTQKVKKVMFVYILELLNGEGHQAFFDLTKGTRLATQAQKQKKQLAWKRNCTLRQEHQKATMEVAQGTPQWQCRLCGCKFTTHKAVKRHRCPLSKEVSSKVGMEKIKGNTKAPPKPNKLAPSKTPPAPSAPHPMPSPTMALVVVVACPPPSDMHKVACVMSLAVTLHGVVQDPIQLQPQPSGSCQSRWLDTVEKHNIQRGVLDSVHGRT
jgi:hypothetical protein